MDPSVGRIVHYVSMVPPAYTAGAHHAAIVTEVLDGGPGIGVDSIGLCVVGPTALYFRQRVLYDETAETGGTWHWPEREG